MGLGMSVFRQGVYCRATDNQVDPADYDGEISGTVNYPRTSAQGNTIGWEVVGTLLQTRDRTGPTDVRLKGVIFIANNGTTADYRIDLPAAGKYNIRAALGDATFSQSNCKVEFRDGTTVFATPQNNVSTTAGQWHDATGVIRTSEADWVANNAILTYTFTGTIFRIRIGGIVGTTGTQLAAIYIEAASPGSDSFVLDLGPYPGVSDAEFTVAAPGIVDTSRVEAWIQPADTAAGWTADGFPFSGQEWLERGAGLTGLANSGQGIMSFWFASQVLVSAVERIFGGTADSAITDGGVSVAREVGSDRFEVIVHGPTAIDVNLAGICPQAMPIPVWRHCLASWDIANNLGSLYIDDVLVDSNINRGAIETPALIGNTNWAVGKTLAPAPRKFYFIQATPAPNVAGAPMNELVPGADVDSLPQEGWKPGTTAAPNYQNLTSASVRGIFQASALPTQVDNADGNFFATDRRMSGSFAAGNWTASFPIIATAGNATAAGRMRFQLWKGPDQTGAGSTQITAGTQLGSILSNITTTEQISTLVFNPGAFTLNNEYLFIACAWEITTASTDVNSNVIVRFGSNGFLLSSNFTPANVQCALGEAYFAPGQFLDFTVAANRRKFNQFVGGLLLPVSLGTDGSLPTGVAPIIYLHLDNGEAASNFNLNRGSGGNFAWMSGSIANRVNYGIPLLMQPGHPLEEHVEDPPIIFAYSPLTAGASTVKMRLRAADELYSSGEPPRIFGKWNVGWGWAT